MDGRVEKGVASSSIEFVALTKFLTFIVYYYSLMYAKIPHLPRKNPSLWCQHPAKIPHWHPQLSITNPTGLHHDC